MRVARIVEGTRAEGPGIRSALWLQGCPHGCPGCYAGEFQPFDGGTEMSVQEVFERIRNRSGAQEGITLLGGEPLAQAEELSELLGRVREEGLTVITFTGYLYEDLLASGTAAQKRVLEQTDVLIDGPYLETERDLVRPHVGSRNQRFLYLTDRYGPADLESAENRAEIRIDRRGHLTINGMGNFTGLEEMLAPAGLKRPAAEEAR